MKRPVTLADLMNHPAAGPLLLLAFAFAVRAIWFGDPVIQVDEQFYLLTGDRLLHGALPFVDIWDRKPIGLFLLYAGIRLLGGTGIVEYQVVGTLFAWGTAMIISRVARSVASRPAAWLAGAIYLLWINLFTGQGGQSPVFYNLFVAAAGLLTLRATVATSPARRMLLGMAAMALCGIAMQVKYTALFEGIFFGLTLLWTEWRASRRVAPLLGKGVVWVAIAILPSAAVLAYYTAIGEQQAFLYANVLSVMERGNATGLELLHRLGVMALLLSPLLVALAWAVRAGSWRERDQPAYRFVLLWFGAAVAGLLVFGTYYDHYALPLLVSLSAAAAPAFDHVLRGKRIGMRLAAVLVAIGLAAIPIGYRITTKRKGDADYIARITSVIDANLKGGCLYVYDGEPILYHLTKACAPTKFLFPNHLNELIEAPAIGVDSVVEERRILATRPQVIVDGTLRPQYRTAKRIMSAHKDANMATRAVIDPVLARDYRLVAQFPLKKRYRRVWVLRSNSEEASTLTPRSPSV